MTWTPVTTEQIEFALQVSRYIQIARQRYGDDWWPSKADISKSALLERMRTGKEPLDEPPPLGLSCPWYAIVEDPGPHYVGAGGWGVSFNLHPDLHPEESDIVYVLQHAYRIIDQTDEPKVYTIKDCRHPPTSYEFMLWYDPDWQHPSAEHLKGSWFIQNKVFYAPVDPNYTGL